MKTLSDVLRDADIEYQTLIKYISIGLLPKPRRVWRGRKGSQSLYPDEIIDIINQIKLLKKQGLSLTKIAEQVRSERASIRVLKPSEELLLPFVEQNGVKSLLKGYKDFDGCVQNEVQKQAPGSKVIDYVVEDITKKGERFLRCKEIRVQ
jgi:DNA-binding transcriptional MerR regulator